VRSVTFAVRMAVLKHVSASCMKITSLDKENLENVYEVIRQSIELRLPRLVLPKLVILTDEQSSE
jgi:hypothetical protein